MFKYSEFTSPLEYKTFALWSLKPKKNSDALEIDIRNLFDERTKSQTSLTDLASLQGISTSQSPLDSP